MGSRRPELVGCWPSCQARARKTLATGECALAAKPSEAGRARQGALMICERPQASERARVRLPLLEPEAERLTRSRTNFHRDSGGGDALIVARAKTSISAPVPAPPLHHGRQRAARGDASGCGGAELGRAAQCDVPSNCRRPPSTRAPLGTAAGWLALVVLFGCLLVQAPPPTGAKSIESAPQSLSADANRKQQILPPPPPNVAPSLSSTLENSREEFKSQGEAANRIEETQAKASDPGEELSLLNKRTTKSEPEAETATESGEVDEIEEDGATGAGDADHDASDCKGLSAGAAGEGARLPDNARLVRLQACLQAKMRAQLKGATRAGGLELFEKLSLSGGCSASLMNLMLGLGQLKSFAFKFLDASAKIPSGVMHGLLSDFGDFDQCLSIRANEAVEPAQEVEEGTYSGKYCLLSLKFNLKVRPEPDGRAPEGIDPDGLLWDRLLRNYWASNSSKGFQVGVCVPSRCNQDDLEQLYKLAGDTYGFQGQVTSCQDGNDLLRQQTPDLLQRLILVALVSLLALNLTASLLERHQLALQKLLATGRGPSLLLEALLCFSIQRNWCLFLRLHHQTTSRQALHCEKQAEGAVRPVSLSFEPAGLVATTERRPLRHQAESLRSNWTELTRVTPGELSHQASFASDEEELPNEPLGSGERKGGLVAVPNGSSEAAEPRVLERCYQQLRVKVSEEDGDEEALPKRQSLDEEEASRAGRQQLLGHLSGLKLLVLVWITVGHSFLYPSANNYQYYRSIIKMNITRDSVWFAATNFTLGIDTLLYLLGLLFAYELSAPVVLAKRENQLANGMARHDELCLKRGLDILQLLARKLLRFWPAYLTVIALAIVLPLLSDGPQWPEMVERRLGTACRQNWWANLLLINNFVGEPSSLCLPSSWFISVIMQCFLLGAPLMLVVRRVPSGAAFGFIGLLVAISSLIVFTLAYQLGARAPAIRMDESFVLEIDPTIFRLYTSTFSNLGPFLVGMLGGLWLVRWQARQLRAVVSSGTANCATTTKGPTIKREPSTIDRLASSLCELNAALAVGLVALLVLSSVFHTRYTRFWAAVYWSCHRIGWALVSGYLVHQCATGRLCLIRDLLAIGALRPLSRLTFLAYLVYPIFIHLHSGLVRDGLHVSLYNMLNIYTTRLVMTFGLALALYLLVQRPIRSLERLLLARWHLRATYSLVGLKHPTATTTTVAPDENANSNRLPLLALAQPVKPLVLDGEKAAAAEQDGQK